MLALFIRNGGGEKLFDEGIWSAWAEVLFGGSFIGPGSVPAVRGKKIFRFISTSFF